MSDRERALELAKILYPDVPDQWDYVTDNIVPYMKDCRTATEEHCARKANDICMSVNQPWLGKKISNALWSGK